MSGAHNTHGTGLRIGRHGILLRGPSGAGKSLLALGLIDWAEARGVGARLVSDDRVDLSAERGGLVMRAPKPIAGLIELRGRGIVSRPHVMQCRLHLVVDLVEEAVRFLEEDALRTVILGVPLARAPVPRRGLVDHEHQRLLVVEALNALAGTQRGNGEKTS